MTQQNNQVERSKHLGNYISFPATQKFLENALKDRKTEFVSNLLALYDADDNLQKCDPGKLVLCAMNATALNLPLNKNLGYAYIIPYNGVPQFQIGYKGLIQLALRSGQYECLNACEVREGEIQRNKFTGEIKFLGEKPDAKVIGYLAYLRLQNGFTASLYMTEDQIEKHALRFSKSYAYDKSQGKRSSKWSDPDARPKMAVKTVLKGLLGTYGVLSPELVKAMESDNDTESDNNGHRMTIDADVIQQEDQQQQNVSDEPEKVQI